MFAGGAAVAALAARPRGGRARVLSSAIVLAGALAGSFAQFEMRGISRNFDAYWDSRSARAEEALDERLDDLTTMGEEAVRRIGNLASGGTGTSILEGLRDIREETGMTLATIYGSDGGFEVWDGVHRGVVPEELRTGEVRFLYRDRPLFSYLYFTAPIPGGGTAMAAALIKANLPRNLEEDPGDFLRDFRDGVGEDLRIFRADRPTDEEVYDWVWEDQALFSVAVVRPTQEQRLAEVRAVHGRGSWVCWPSSPGWCWPSPLGPKGPTVLLRRLPRWDWLFWLRWEPSWVRHPPSPRPISYYRGCP